MADHHYQPVSGISIEGDVAAGQKYVPRAKKMLRRLQDRVKHSHSNLATDHVRLDDDAYLHLGKPGEEEVVITVVGVPEVEMAGMNVLLMGW